MKRKAAHFLAACMAGLAALHAAPIVYAEYVISSGSPDNDPGLGQGTEITIAENTGAASLALTLPAEALPLENPGTYLLSIRLRDAGNLWTTHTRTFQIPAPRPALPEPAAITHVETFIAPANPPNMPAEGQTVSLLNPPGLPAGDGIYTHVFSPESLSSLPPGVYRTGVRARTAGGLWTTVLGRTFAIPGNTEPQFYYPRWRVRNQDGQIIQSGALAENPLVSFPANFDATLPVGGAAPGTHSVEISLEDAQGTPGALESRSFQVMSHADFWRETYFTDPARRADPAISGPLADANGDGIPNLLAYLLGLDPETAAPPVLRTMAGPPGSPRAELRVPWEIPPGGTLRVLASPDLSSPFVPATEITAPRAISHAAPFSGTLPANIQAGHPSVFINPPSGIPWDNHGFFRLETEFTGEWPYAAD